MAEPTKEVVAEQQKREPTIIFLFDMKNWFETISPLSKLDLFDIVPFVSTQFYMDYSINAYVLILTKTKWDSLNDDVKKKFMFISRRLKEEMEGPMTSSQRETYENADIFKLLMGEASMSQEEQEQLSDQDVAHVEKMDLNTIVEEEETVTDDA
jgi:hypothetical protein